MTYDPTKAKRPVRPSKPRAEVKRVPGGAHHHQAHCEQTLALMESIAATIPDAVWTAKQRTYEECLQRAVHEGRMTQRDADQMFLSSPYAPMVQPGRHSASEF
jgi:hypothetical protein